MQEKQRAFLVRTAYWTVWAVLLWLGAFDPKGLFNPSKIVGFGD